MNWAEKDKDLLQMIIGGTACNACGICKEVSHATMFCPQHTSQPGVYKQQGQYTNTTTHNNNMNTRATQICHFFNGTVSGSGTGPLDYGATGPVPDPETLILGVGYRTPSHAYEDCLGVR